MALLCGPLVGIAVHLGALAQVYRTAAPRTLDTIEMPYQDVWIVVPAFNEASVIGDVVADLRSAFEHVVWSTTAAGTTPLPPHWRPARTSSPIR